MKYVNMGDGSINASQIGLGLWKIGQVGITTEDVNRLLNASFDAGINFFDNSDIYSRGKSEEMMGAALKLSPGLREKIYVQTKCGIKHCESCTRYYDFSKEHILKSVDGSLKRLQMDYVDALLLHRPDALIEPEEVAEAFDTLQASGKVRHFGVSNHNPNQLKLLAQYMHQKIFANQVQLSLTHTPIIDFGIAANSKLDQSIDRDGGILDYCRLAGIQLQAWSPLRSPAADMNAFIGQPGYEKLNGRLEEYAAQYGVKTSAIAIAWILRHPTNIQPILGSTKVAHVLECCEGADITLTREQWYDLYSSAGNYIP